MPYYLELIEFLNSTEEVFDAAVLFFVLSMRQTQTNNWVSMKSLT